MDTAHPLENQRSASIPHPDIDPDLKPEDRPTTALLIELVPGENGVYKVASTQAGGVQLSDTELALVQAFRDSETQKATDASTAAAEEAAKTTVPAASISDAEQQQLDDYKAFQAWQANKSAPVDQTGQGTGDGTEDYVGPSESGS